MAKGTSNGRAKPGKKKLYILITGIVLVIVIVAIAAYYWESKTNIAKITWFSYSIGGTLTEPVEQVLYKFYFKVENQGTNDISGLTLRVKVLGDGAELGSEHLLLQTLPHGQEKDPGFLGVWVNVTDIGSKTITFAATLELDNRTIDDVTLTS